MKRLIAFILFVCLTFSVFAFALIERHKELDLALSLLEKDNIFLRRYNEITGANIEARFELGMPYLYGGQNPASVFAQYPKYGTRVAFEDSLYYRKDVYYILGFDCSGFARWINLETKKQELESLGNLINLYYKYRENQIFSQNEKLKPPPYNELKDHLKIGDYLVTRGTTRHIMMYIGTLRDYGFTEDEVPELYKYLDYPLVIHSSAHPQFPDRFQKLIDENKEYSYCTTTDGGVNVSIVGVPIEEAPYHMHLQVTDFAYYLLDEGRYYFTVRDMTPVTSFVWFRSSPR